MSKEIEAKLLKTFLASKRTSGDFDAKSLIDNALSHDEDIVEEFFAGLGA